MSEDKRTEEDGRKVDPHNVEIISAVKRAKLLLIVTDRFSDQFVTIEAKSGGYAVGFKDGGEVNRKLAKATAMEAFTAFVDVAQSIVSAFSKGNVRIGQRLSDELLKPIRIYL